MRSLHSGCYNGNCHKRILINWNPFNRDVFKEHDFVVRSHIGDWKEEINDEIDRNGMPRVQGKSSIHLCSGSSFLGIATLHIGLLKTLLETK